MRKETGVFLGMEMGVGKGVVAGVMRWGVLGLIVLCQFLLWTVWWVEQNDLMGLEDWLDTDFEIDLGWCGLESFDLEMEDMLVCVRTGLMLGWLVGECAVLTAHRRGWNWNIHIPRAEQFGRRLCFWK